MNKLKITANYADYRISSLVINGEEISCKISELILEMKEGEFPRALIEVPLSEIEVEGEFDVLKKIPEEKRKSIDLENNNVFNISPNIKEELINEVKERIVQDIKKACQS